MKALIDKWFTDNYETLREVTNAWIVRTGRNIDAEYIISSSYIYVIGRMGEMTKEDIPRWVYHYINVELIYPKSTTNKRNNKFNVESVDVSDVYNVCADSDFVDYISVSHQIEAFRTTLDRYDQIIWDVYIKKGLTKKRELAEHFKIDETSAWFLIKNLKEKYIEYAKTKEGI